MEHFSDRTTALKWVFTPAEILEGPLTLEFEGVSIAVASGVATATLKTEAFVADSAVRFRLEEELRAHLDAAGILEGKAVGLKFGGREDVDPDGRRHTFLEVGAGMVTVTGLRADIQVKNANGNTVVDTRADRIAVKRRLASLLAKHQPIDAVLRATVRSFRQAMSEPDAQLVRLYEVYEGIRHRFGNLTEAASALAFPVADLKRLRKVCITRACTPV